MPLAQFLAVRRSRSNPQLVLPPLSSSLSTAGRPQHQIFSSSSATITVARATHFSTSAPPSLHRASGTGGPHQTTYPQVTSHHDDAAAGDDRPRAVLTLEEVMTNYDTSILFSDSPVASALQTPSPASSLLPSSPLDGGSFWDKLDRVDEAREEDRAAAVDDDGIGSSPPRLRTRGGGRAQAVHYTDPGSPIPPAVDTGEDGEESCLIEKEEAAAVYGDVWRNRDKDRGDLPWAKGFQRPEWACPEWASVRRKINRDEEMDGGRYGGDVEPSNRMAQESHAPHWIVEDLTDSLGEGHDGYQTVIRRSGAGKGRIGSENWERLLRTPSPPVQAPSFLSYDGPPAMADLPAAPTQARKKRITRARRLTADPTPNRLAAAKGTTKHFRKMNSDQACVASPTVQALSAGTLPLLGVFQITIGSERGDDPFPALVEQPEQDEADDTMDEIDSCLTGIWNLYANGDRQSRLLLLRDLRRTMAVQEARGVRSGPAESED